jgi:CDP-glucose 4,6-dehydratase
MSSVSGDVRDLGRLTAVVSETRPEIVFHLAAQSLVRASYANPVETYSTNIMGTVHLLEAARLAPGARAVVNVTSDKCYANQERARGYREDEPMGGNDPYSSSKGCAELVSAAYAHSFFRAGRGTPIAMASARAGNAIGGGDWSPDRLMPDLMRAFASNRPAVIRRPESVRPWQHVLDTLNGYLELAERLSESAQLYEGGWNFGPPEEDSRPVGWIADRTVRLWGDGARWEVDRSAHPPEAGCLTLDAAKARARLGWSPRLPLAEALEWTVAWYREYSPDRNMRGSTEAQIARFQNGGRL